VERTANKPKIMPPVTVADDNLPMASSLDMPLIQNNMLGARDATVRLKLVMFLGIFCVALYLQRLLLLVTHFKSCQWPQAKLLWHQVLFASSVELSLAVNASLAPFHALNACNEAHTFANMHVSAGCTVN